MKKVSLKFTDVDVTLIKFVNEDAYAGFSGVLEDRKTEEVESETKEILNIQARNPIALVKQADGSYYLITPKTLAEVY